MTQNPFDFFGLLKPGECGIIAAPTPEIAGQAMGLVSASASGHGKLLTFDSRDAHDPSGAIKDIKQRLGKTGSRFLLAIDGRASNAPWLAKSAHCMEFVQKISGLVQREHAKAVFVFTREQFAATQWSELKDEAAFFWELFFVGPTLHGQFLHARGIASREFFFPLPIDFTTASAATGPENSEEAAGLLMEPYRFAFENSGDGILLFDARGSYREMNKRGAEILGYSQDEILQIPLSRIIAPRSYRAALRALLAARKRNKISLDVDITRKSGRTSRVNCTVVGMAGGRSIATLRDVSEERRDQEQQRETADYFRGLVDGSAFPQGVYANRKLVGVNSAFHELFSWVPKEEGIALHQLFGKTNAPLTKQVIAFADAEGEDASLLLEAPIHAPGGKALDLRVSIRPFLNAGKRLLQMTFTDVTGTKEHTRKLEESERKYRVLIENHAEALTLVKDGVLLFANKGFAGLLGFDSPDELIGKEFSSLVITKDRKQVLQHLALDEQRSATPRSFEYTALRKDGSQVAIEGRAETIEWNDAACVLTAHRDISGHLKVGDDTRRKVKESETLEHMHRAFHGSVDVATVLAAGLDSSLKGLAFESGGVYRLGDDGTTLTLVEQRGLSEKILSTLSVQNTQEGVTGYVARTLEPLLLLTSEYPAHLPYKSLFESEKIAAVAYAPLAVGENLAGILLLCSTRAGEGVRRSTPLLTSVSQSFGLALANALQYERLARAEMNYRSMVDENVDVLYRALPHGGILFISSQVERLLGHTAADLIKNPELWRMCLHPDDRVVYSERIANQAKSVDRFEIEYRILPKGKAAYRWVRDAVRYQRDAQGELVGMIGTVSDITEKRETEGKLQGTGELSNNVLESVQEGVVVCDSNFRFVAWNRAMESLTKLPREEIQGRNATEGPLSGGLQLLPPMKRALEGESITTDELSLRWPGSEEERFLSGRFSPLRDNRGVITGVVGTVTDVTARRGLERELRESEETLRNVIDAMGDALMISDLQGRVWEVNREFSNITGYQRSEVLGTTVPYPWLIEEEMATFVTWIAALRERKFLRDFDMTWRAKDGRQVAISLNTTLLRNALGEPMAMLNIGRDISERKHLGNELAAKNKQIEMLNRIISKANSTLDFSHMFDIIAVEVLNLLAYDQMTVYRLTDDGDAAIVLAALSPGSEVSAVGEHIPLAKTAARKALEQGATMCVGNLDDAADGDRPVELAQGMKSFISIPIVLNGTVLGAFNMASAMAGAYSGKELAFLQPIADQIGAMIDRSQLFQQVSDDSRYIHNLLNSLDSVVYTVDRSFHVREMNDAWGDFARYIGTPEVGKESDVLGRSPEEIIPVPSLWEEVRKVVPDLFAGTREYFSTEFEIRGAESRKTYHLAINPMVIGGTVSFLVLAQTDITESKKTEEEIKRRNKELLALNTVSTSISTSLNLDEVLTVAAGQIKEISGADIVLCYMRDERENRLVLARELGLEPELTKIVQELEVEGSAFGKVVTTRKPLRLHSPLKEDPIVTEQGRNVAKVMGIKGMLALPLMSKEHVLGVLAVGFTRDGSYTGLDERFLGLVGNQLGSAIENAQLYTELQAQVQRVTSLYELGKGMSGALDRKNLLEIVSMEVGKVIPFERLAYHVLHQAEGILEKMAEAEDGSPHLLERGERDMVVVNSEPAYRGIIESGTSYMGPIGQFGSGLAVPVFSKDKIAGVISLCCADPGRYDEAHLRLLESIANLTKIALDRAMLYEDTLTKTRELEYRNKELDDFTYVVSHDLKEPLITIEGYSKIVLKEYENTIDQEGKGYLASVVQSSARMKGLIDDLLTLSRLGRAADLQETISVADVLKDLAHDFEFTLRERNATIELPDVLPSVRYNATQLSMVFRNLISNAVKFNTSAQPHVAINVTEDAAEYTFAVADNGIGIEREHFDKIFVIFQRLQRSEDYRGTGAGLTIVKKIIEKHHGRIWLESVPGQGTKFFFTIPK